MLGIISFANIIKNFWNSILYVIPGNVTFSVSKNWPLEQDSQRFKKKKRKKRKTSVNISIQMQALVLRQRISENCWDLDWLVVYQAVVILPVLGNNGIMTCRSSIITLKKTLDHCKKVWVGYVPRILPSVSSLSSNFSNIKAITSIQQLLPARQVSSVTQLSELVRGKNQTQNQKKTNKKTV